MDHRKTTGRRGEDLAASYLEKQGYRLVERNWRCPAGELDLIVQKEEVLVFVEVRTRRGQCFGTAEESVTPAKQTRLIELAHTYVQTLPPPSPTWRIDVIAVRLGPGEAQLNHIENAVGW